MARNIGGSILPSAGWGVYGVKRGLYGSFETRPLEERDTHGLYYSHGTEPDAGELVLIASHPNGYSCDELAKRMIIAWAEHERERALQQFDYILACGGSGVDRSVIEDLAGGVFDGEHGLRPGEDGTRPAF